MENSKILSQRLINQHIAESQFNSAQELVAWMGAIQAQDSNMVKWALGSRLPLSTNKMIEEEMDKGKILRTHLMRPTWHLVSSDDIYWMLDLTVPQIKVLTRTRHKELGLSDDVVKEHLRLIEKALEKENHLTREELMYILLDAGIRNENNLVSHILLCAEMEGLVCSGPIKGNKQSFALLEQRVQKKKLLKRDEAIALLTKKYFQSHGPATLQDFVWWSGLPVKDARLGIELNKKDFIPENHRDDTYWSVSIKSIPETFSVYLLAAFDEYLIAYRDRSPVIISEDTRKAISSNGMFRPIIVVSGQVAGVWRREIKKGRLFVEIDLFELFNDELILNIREQVDRFAEFNGLKADIQFKKLKPLK